MNSKTRHLIIPFSILGVAFLGIGIFGYTNSGRVTPSLYKRTKEDSIKAVREYQESKKRDSIYFAKIDSVKRLRDSLRNRRVYTYILKVTVTPDNIIFTARKSGYQQVTLDAHYTKPQLYYQVFTSTKQMSIEEASAYADNNPDKVTILTPEQYNGKFGNQSSEYDIFTEGLDSYYDDPENLDENPDEIYDFLLD